jgi:hypothetical protein
MNMKIIQTELEKWEKYGNGNNNNGFNKAGQEKGV